MMQIVYVGEEMPESFSKSLFFAGPTPRSNEVKSWRHEALELLEAQGYDGVVFIPETRNGEFHHSYDDQVEWEERYLKIADCIVFWVPRNLETMPAFTTNVEYGVWLSSGKVVFGAPPDAPKNTYLKFYAEKYNIPMSDTLSDTLASAIKLLGPGAKRDCGERYVPLLIWNTEQFQSWFDNGVKDNKLLMLLMKDLEDGSLFPVYFDSEAECQRYKDCIISESKLKVIDSYYLKSGKLMI